MLAHVEGGETVAETPMLCLRLPFAPEAQMGVKLQLQPLTFGIPEAEALGRIRVLEEGMRLAIITNSFIVPRLSCSRGWRKKRGTGTVVFRYTDWWWDGSEILEVREWRSVSFRVPFLRDDIFFHFDHRVLNSVLHERFDVIIAYGYGSLTTWLVAGLAKFRGIPFVLFTDARSEYERKRHRMVRLAKKILHR